MQDAASGIAHILVLGAPSGYTGWDQVKVYNGATQELMYNLCAFPGQSGGVEVAAGLVTSTGIPNIVVSTIVQNDPHLANAVWVRLYDATSLLPLDTFQPFGNYMGQVNIAAGTLSMTDIVNGKPVRDDHGVIAVATGQGGNGETRLFTFNPGYYHAIYWDAFVFTSYYTSGISIAIGDTGHYGYNQLIVGEQHSTTPWVSVYGTDMVLWGTFQVPYFTSGVAVAAGYFAPGLTLAIGEYGAIVFFNGQSLTPTSPWNGYTPQQTSEVYLAAGNFNANGSAQLVVSDVSAPNVLVWSATTNNWYWEIWEPFGTLPAINVAAY